MFQHILLAADGSDNSIRAAAEAVKIASLSSDAVVEILFAADPSKVKDEVLHSHTHDEIEFRRRQRLQSVEEVLTAAGLQPKVTIINGDPGPTIVKYADEHHADLIIIGTRGLNVLQEFVLGSVSHKVVKRAHCPVLIVK
ncbi:universal stress protein [Paenibacillus wulumuqiensis]|uniref:universal stress protein n=1 Tax=Paenibacillus wulumuqiensis TaxID=1567107 RepID=UPI000619D380|nr:universal stress protein [Paenibacillus wulumuqiensis]